MGCLWPISPGQDLDWIAAIDSRPVSATLRIVRGSWVYGIALMAALVAPGWGFTAISRAVPASAAAEALPTCAPITGPGWQPYEPWMVFFDSGSAKITPETAVVLTNAAIVYRPFPKCVLSLGAHIDGREATRSDRLLSARRANAVIHFLRNRGVKMRTKIEVFGDTSPLVETPRGAAEAQNRRVTIVMMPETFR